MLRRGRHAVHLTYGRTSRGRRAILGLDGTVKARFDLDSPIYDRAAPDESVLVATGSKLDEAAEVFTIAATEDRRMKTRRLGEEIGAAVAVGPRPGEIVVAYHLGVDVCAVDSLEPRLHLDLGDQTACSVACSSDGKTIAVGTQKRTLRLFDAVTGREHLG